MAEYALAKPGLRLQQVGEKFGVCRSTVSGVVAGMARHVVLAEEDCR